MIKCSKLGSLVVFSLASAGNSIGTEARSQSTATNSIPEPEPDFLQSKSTIWKSEVGEGFLPTAQTVSLEAGVAPGVAIFGGRQAHDFALLSLSEDLTIVRETRGLLRREEPKQMKNEFKPQRREERREKMFNGKTAVAGC